MRGFVGYFDFSWSWIFLLQYFLLVFMCRESWWGHCPWIVFSQIYCTFFMIYTYRLRFCEPFFKCGLLCLFYVFFFSQPHVVNITWITGHIHRSIVDKIDPTSKDVERVKNTLGYIFLWNVIRRIYLPCLQLISKNYCWWTVKRTPPLFLVQKWKNGLWWHL